MSQDLGSQLQNLYQQYGHIEGVQFELHQNLISVYVQSPLAEARVFLQGAQVSHFQPAGHQPVLWLSDANVYQRGQPLRGGIPISWPWFAEFSKNPAELQRQINADEPPPAHGFARNHDWQLTELSRSGDVFELQFGWQPQSPWWPFDCTLSLKVVVGRELSVQLTVHNAGSEAFYYAPALHSYFAVGDVRRVLVTGLEGQSYFDATNQWQLAEQVGDLTVDGELDRIYEQVPDAIELVDPALERTIRINQQGLPSLVTWNPWHEKGARLSQFHSDDYHKMLCLERAALLKNDVLCESGAYCHQNLVITVT